MPNSNDYSYSFDSGVSEKVLLKWNLDDVVPYTQIQASAIMSASSNVSISSMVIIENR